MDAKTAPEPDTLEQAAREVVARKNKTDAANLLEVRRRGEMNGEVLDRLTRYNVEITADEVRKVTGFGEEGAKLVANYSNTDGATFGKVMAEVKTSYMTGFEHPDLDIKKGKGTFISPVQENAYTAGQMDRKMQDLAAKERFKNAVVNMKSGFLAENLPSDVTKNQVKILNIMAEGLGVKSYVVKGLKGNAEYNRKTGEVPIDFDFEREIGQEGNRQKVSIVFHAAHEMALHRVVDLAPEEGSAFVYAMYNHIAGNKPSVYPVADEKRNAYAAQDVEISLAEAMEEVSANNILYLYGNDEVKFHKAIDSIINGTDEKAKQGLRKYVDFLKNIIKKIGDFLAGKSGKEKAEGQTELDEIIKLRDMFEMAFAKAVENKKAVEQKQSKHSAETQKNTGTEGGVNFSLKTVDNQSAAESKNGVVSDAIDLTDNTDLSARIENQRGSEKYKIIRDYILETLGEEPIVLSDGIVAKVDKSDALHLANKSANKKVSYIAKIKTIIEQAKLYAIDDQVEHKKFDAFRYYQANVKYGDDVYPVYLNVGRAKNGDGHHIYDITRKIGAIAKQNNALERVEKDLRSEIDSPISKKIISQNTEFVKSDFSLKEEKNSNDLEKKAETAYNKEKGYSQKNWRTDLNASQFKQVETWLRQIDNHEPKRIADTDACWYKGRIDGKDLFVIYSTATSGNPTILYERKGVGANIEQNILLTLLEEIENGESDDRKSAYVDWVSRGGWMQKVNGSQNHLRNLGSGRHNQNAGVLQRQSQRNGSPAFRNVLEDILKKSEQKRYSLKDNEGTALNEATTIEKMVEDGIYDYTKSFAQQVDDWKNGLIPQNDSLLVGATPKVFKEIGFNPLPFTINQRHIDYAINGTKDTDHGLGKALLDQLPQALKTPLAIISSQTQTGRVVAILKIQHNGKNVVAPVEINGHARQNNIRIDSNAIASVFGKGNAITKLLADALNDEAKGNISVFYWNKKEALSLLQRAGLQLSGGLPQDGFIHSITENGSPVKPRLKNITESQQFKRWFGNSKVVNEDGTPKVVYHGTSKGGHTVFDAWGRGKFGLFGIGIYMTENREVAEGYTKKGKGTTPQVYELYANIINPLDMDKTADVKKWEKHTSGEIDFSNCTTNEDCFRAVKEYCEDEGMVRWEAEEYITEMIRDMEYDGITHIGGGRYNKQDATRHRVWIALDSTQIKSATDNIGTFDMSNPDVNYSLKGTSNTMSDGARKMDVSERIAKYAEDGVIPTEVYEELIEKYGAIPTGETPHRDVKVPKETEENKKVSQTMRTILEAKATPDEALPTIEKMVEDGVFSYDVYTDEKAIKDAGEHLKDNGWSQSFTERMRDVEKGVVSKQHTVMGWALYNNAVNTAAETTSETERREAIETAFSVLDGMVRHQRSAAQTLQATRILKMLSPETQLYGVQKGKND
ncbi:MAG: hypothetical protein E7390_01675 [Ruminococcaceae bacterium]|nr:hypothetical protein [Oscillospiraceae bacterium]